MTSFFLVCFKEAVVTLPASEPASSADVESVIPSLQTIIHPHFTRRLLGSFVPRGRHTLMHRPRKKRAWCEDRPGMPADRLAGLKCTGVKEKQMWRPEEEIVSVWSERDYLVSTSSRADARISARACTP